MRFRIFITALDELGHEDTTHFDLDTDKYDEDDYPPTAFVHAIEDSVLNNKEDYCV